MYMKQNNRPYEVPESKKTKVGRFTIIQDTLKIKGKEYPYSYEIMDDSVCVLPIVDNNIVLIRQYRHSLDEWIWEIPAGGLSGDSPDLAAKRELLEETGYQATNWIDLGDYYITPGTSSAKTYFYVAFCDEYIGKQTEETEFIETSIVTEQEFKEMLDKHMIVFSGIVVAWYRYCEIRRRERECNDN